MSEQEEALPYIGLEQSITALGREWKLSRLTLDKWMKFVGWVKKNFPDPITVAERLLNLIPPSPETQEERIRISERAQDMAMAFLSIMSPQCVEILNTIEGSSYILYLLLKDHHPEMDERCAYDIAFALGTRKVEGLVTTAQGLIPPKEQAVAE